MNLKLGGIYKHYKGKYYLIKGLANDGNFVCYQQLYGNFGHWIRDTNEFKSPLDDGSERYRRVDYLKDEYVDEYSTALLEIVNNLYDIKSTPNKNNEILPIKHGFYVNSKGHLVSFLNLAYDHHMNVFVYVKLGPFDNCWFSEHNNLAIPFEYFIKDWTYVSNPSLVLPKC